MAKLTFNTDNCKGCGLCVDACPKGLLALSEEKIKQSFRKTSIMQGQRADMRGTLCISPHFRRSAAAEC